MEIEVNKRKHISSEMRQSLLKKYSNQCCMCKVSGETVPLNISTILSLHSGGEISEDNLIVLCPNCHQLSDRTYLKESEFIDSLTEILKSSNDYISVEKDTRFGSNKRYEADIIARKVSKTVLIECKSYRSISKNLAANTINQMKAMGEELPQAELVLAVYGRLTDEIRKQIESEGITVWDLDYLAKTYSKQISLLTNPMMRMLIGASNTPTQISKSKELLDKLKKCNPGRKDCYIYQNLVGEIIEEVFCPPLQKPLGESSDHSKSNRRDFIIPNYANEGFWAFLRGKYDADYIVVDAKNYTRKVKKNDVLQVANYLKPHGAGMFGLIFSRNGGDSRGCEQTLREQWMVHNKMIVILDDEDVENILVSSTVSGATDVIGRKIEEFRLSM
ncbi:HNH endonuclease [Vibrio harveyi]